MNAPQFTNVASHLTRMAEVQPDRVAVLSPLPRRSPGKVEYAQWTFQELERESNLFANTLESLGIGRGVRTVLMVKPSLEFFGLTFALFKVGAVPVLVDPGMGIKPLQQCLDEAAPAAFLGIHKAHVARVLFGWGKRTLRTKVLVGGRWFPGAISLTKAKLGQRNEYRMAETQPEDVAAILFTSGSTGPPKGAIYTHGIFANQVEMLRTTYGIEPGEVDLPTFPLFGLFAPALGITSVIPDMDFTRPGFVDPQNVIEPIQRFSITMLFGSPALLKRVGTAGVQLPSLRRVISAGAPVAPKVLEQFSTMLRPEVEIHTPYGATEALPVCSIGSHEILGETRQLTAQGKGICVGKPVAGMDVRIIRISDEPIPSWSDDLVVPQGVIGEIAVRGPVVTQAYYNRPEATRLAKIRDATTGEIVHRMGDVGYVDERGRIWFCGRKAHRVVTTKGTLFTIPCEAIFNQHPAVARTALVGATSTQGIVPLICVELEPMATKVEPERLFAELRELRVKYPHVSEIQTFLIHPGFPVDVRHNAKINREQLAIWATRQLR